MEKWLFAAETATYPSYIFFPSSHMGMEKEILGVSCGYSAPIKSMNALTWRRCSSFSDATYWKQKLRPYRTSVCLLGMPQVPLFFRMAYCTVFSYLGVPSGLFTKEMNSWNTPSRRIPSFSHRC